MNTVRRYPADRRPRLWRYVSPRRHWVGLLLLGFLIGGVAGYFYVTRDSNIRRIAQARLTDKIGQPVRIESAEFSLFGKLDLGGVEIQAPKGTDKPSVLNANKLHVRFSPLSIFTKQQVLREIVCNDASVTLEFDTQTQKGNFARIIDLLMQKPRKRVGLVIPKLRFRNTNINLRYLTADGVESTDLMLNAVLFPRNGETYRIAFDQANRNGKSELRGTADIAMYNGELSDLSVLLPLDLVQQVLPPAIRDKVAAYHPSGSLRLKRYEKRHDAPAELAAELVDVSAELPASIGELRILECTGEIAFRPDSERVIVRDLTGKLPQAGNSVFNVNGSWEGFVTDAPFNFDASVSRMEVPYGIQSGHIGYATDLVEEDYGLRGIFDVNMNFRRNEAAGDLGLDVAIKPQKASSKYFGFPYRVDDVTGVVEMDMKDVKKIDLHGEADGAKVSVQGAVQDYPDTGLVDVKVDALDAPFKPEIRDACPKVGRQIWNDLRPGGFADVSVHAYHAGEENELFTDVTLQFNGDASLNYIEFPYPLENLRGTVDITDTGVVVRGVEGTRGTLTCKANGSVEAIDTANPVADLAFSITDLPIDKTLFRALGTDVAERLIALNASGTIPEARAKITQRGDQPVQYDVTGAVKDSAIQPDFFPYPMNNVNGNLHITNDRVEISKFTGRNKQSLIHVDADLRLLESEFRIERAFISAEDLLLDEELRAALPEEYAEVWERLQPSGSTDLSLLLKHPNPDLPEQFDVHAQIKPRDAGVNLRDFPLPIDGITGKIDIQTGTVNIETLSGFRKNQPVRIDGRFNDHGGALLTLQATQVPVDKTLIDAIAHISPDFAKPLKEGGWISLNLDELMILEPSQTPSTAPSLELKADDASEASTQPASGEPEVISISDSHPATQVNVPSTTPSLRWNARGDATFNNVQVKLGKRDEVFSGDISGGAMDFGTGVAINVKAALKEARVSNYRLTDVRGRLQKEAKSDRLRIRQLYAKAYEGQIDGDADIHFTQPAKLQLSASLIGADLSKLANAGKKEDAPPSGMQGNLDGDIRLSATFGATESVKGRGELKIVRAHVDKNGLDDIPVIRELVQIGRLLLPGEEPFDEYTIAYNLRGSKVIVREAYLKGATVSFVGSGTVDLESEEIDMEFLSGPPGSLPRMRGIAEQVSQAIFRELLVVRVTGTLSDTKTEKKPLRSILGLPGQMSDLMRRLLTPRKEK